MLIGARISSRAPAGLVRSALVVVLLASALKLLDVPNAIVGVVSAAAIVTAIVLTVVGRDRRPAHAAETRTPARDPAALS